MKKIIHLFAIAALFLFAFVSCNKGIRVDSIEFDKKEIILHVGGTSTITATILPWGAAERTITWKSSNNSVATVTSENPVKGLVTGKEGGKATITATTKDGKLVASCIVEVATPDPEMISVEGGTFSMGCSTNNCNLFEIPAHQVTVKSFKIGKYLVTEKLWNTVMGENINPVSKEFPMYHISWYDVQIFIKKLNEITGKKYRLPTEAEWEFAARGGNKSQNFTYSGSEDIDEVAWYSENSNYTPHPVGLKKQNELGIYDMSGNMWEWCNDWAAFYTDEAQNNPTGPSAGDTKIARGGSYFNPANSCRVSTRVNIPPDGTGIIGFRLAHD
jgi:formylglycine-generating enzyme required for sulfatase activity